MAFPAWMRPPWKHRRALAYGAILAVLGALVMAAVVVLSGVYNVGASAKHFYITDRLLKLALWRSVDTQSAGIAAPDLDDPGLVRLGARHFNSGCEPCHAAPGTRQNPIAASMYPAAPPLGDHVAGWEDKELFWIVRHGFKFTGMPHWPGEARDDEIWAVVAFIRQLPGMSAEQYADLAGVDAGRQTFEFARPGQDSVAGCALCHGDAENGPISALAPALQGQSEAYLRRALEEYAANTRQSGMMEPVAAELSPEARGELAAEYAAMPPFRAREGATGDPEQIARGEVIAAHGIPQRNVPPCLTCHSGPKSPQFPRLHGLSAQYVANQLRLFRDGARGATSYGSIMAPIAGRMTDEEIEAVAAYVGGMPGDAR